MRYSFHYCTSVGTLVRTLSTFIVFSACSISVILKVLVALPSVGVGPLDMPPYGVVPGVFSTFSETLPLAAAFYLV